MRRGSSSSARIRVPVLFLLLGFLSFLAVLAFLANLGQTAQPIAVVGFSPKTGRVRIPLPPPSAYARLRLPSAFLGELWRMAPTRDDVPPKRREDRHPPDRRDGGRIPLLRHTNHLFTALFPGAPVSPILPTRHILRRPHLVSDALRLNDHATLTPGGGLRLPALAPLPEHAGILLVGRFAKVVAASIAC